MGNSRKNHYNNTRSIACPLWIATFFFVTGNWRNALNHRYRYVSENKETRGSQEHVIAHLDQSCFEIHVKTILSGTSSSIRTKLGWNSHWMVLFQNCVWQSRSTTKMANTVQLRCYWKQLWSRWAITCSWEPLVSSILEEDHPMTIPSKFGSNWATGSRQDGFYVNFP
jgi:hypothetical protein